MINVVAGRVNRDALLDKLASEIDGLNGRIKVIAARRSADGIAISELRAEKCRLERHRSALLRASLGNPEGPGRL